jgi:hypothetical protein
MRNKPLRLPDAGEVKSRMLATAALWAARVEGIARGTHYERAGKEKEREQVRSVAPEIVDVLPRMEQVLGAPDIALLHADGNLLAVVIAVKPVHVDAAAGKPALDKALDRPLRGAAVREYG